MPGRCGQARPGEAASTVVVVGTCGLQERGVGLPVLTREAYRWITSGLGNRPPWAAMGVAVFECDLLQRFALGVAEVTLRVAKRHADVGFDVRRNVEQVVHAAVDRLAQPGNRAADA